MLRSGDSGTAVMGLPGARIATTSLPACSFCAVTYITWSRGTPKVYNQKSTGCNDVIVFFYARASKKKCFSIALRHTLVVLEMH